MPIKIFAFKRSFEKENRKGPFQIVALLPFLGLLLLQQAVVAQQYYLDQYSLQEGLNTLSISCLEEDESGYLWIGTHDKGLSRFDGEDFEKISETDAEIFCIYSDSLSKKLYIGTSEGIIVYNGWQFNRIDFEGAVQNIMMLDSTIWFSSGKAVYRFLNKDAYPIEKIAELPGASPIKLGHIFKNTLFLGNEERLFYYDKGKFRSMDLTPNTGNITSIATIGEHLFVGTQKGLFKIQETAESFSLAQYAAEFGEIYTLSHFQQTALMCYSSALGLSIVHSDDLTSLYTLDGNVGLKASRINCILSSDKGVYWLGSEESGLYKYSSRSYSLLTMAHGLSAANITSLISRDNVILAGNDQGKIDRIEHDIVMDDPYTFPGMHRAISSLAADDYGRIWVGTEGKGLVMRDSTGLLYLDSKGGLVGDFIKKIIVDGPKIWVASTSQGISRISTNKEGNNVFQITNFNRSNGLRHTGVSDLCLAADGQLWVATQDGAIYRIIQDSVYYIEKSIELFDRDPLKSIAIGSDGEVYFLSSRKFGKLKKGRPVLLYEDSSNPLIDMIEYLPGKWLLGGSYGFRNIQVLGENAKNQEFNPGAIFKGLGLNSDGLTLDENGRIWMATQNGVVVYRPDVQEQQGPGMFDIHLKDVLIEYQPIRDTRYANQVGEWLHFEEGFKLAPGIQRLGFSFQAINHAQKENYLYRWKLEGLEDRWSPWKKSSSIQYSNLPAGHYLFKIQAKTGERIVEKESGWFEIQQVFWKKSWFIALSVLGLFFLVIIIAAWRIRYIQKKHRKKLIQMELEGELVQLEQKTRQLQMNPHFLNNTLHAIQSLIVTEKPEMARSYLQEFASLMRMVLNHSRSATVLLEDEIDLLNKYLSLEKFINNNGFDFVIERDQHIDESVRIPAMMLQPFIENAVKHGVRHAGERGKIYIRFSAISAVQIRCTIRDNGKGFAFSQQIQEKRKKKSVSMEILAQRIELLHGRKGKWIQMEELKNDAGKVRGVEVSVILPIT